MIRAAVLLLSLASIGPSAAQTPPQLPPKPPPLAKPKPAEGQRPAERPPTRSMNGLVDYLDDVAMPAMTEIDSPVTGYGNELLWDKAKDAAVPLRASKPKTGRQKRVDARKIEEQGPQ